MIKFQGRHRVRRAQVLVSIVSMMLFSVVSGLAQVTTTYTIITVAGNGGSSSSGDGGQAAVAGLDVPIGTAVDAAGNLYITESGGNRIRKVDTAGIISMVAGNGSPGGSGDGGLAINATLRSPQGIALDSSGNLYFADTSNHRVRKVDTAGIISTVAGTGAIGFSGDGGQAVNASFHSPDGVALDASGNLYISEEDGSRIRKVDTAGIISTVAGTGSLGFSGDGGLATSAMLNNPRQVALDANAKAFDRN